MKRGAFVVLAGLALAGLVPGRAAAASRPVSILFSVFTPTQLDVLPGETVEWSNVSDRLHTVYGDDGSFASSDLLAGARFSHAFTTVGAYAFHCTVHPEMTGEIDVRLVTLETLPPSAVLAGRPVEFAGRTATPGHLVTIERRTGSAYHGVATARPSPNGAWKVTLPALATGDYRAAVGADVSEIRRLLVSTRKVHVRATTHGVAVSVTPSAPGARIALQQYLPERFGWWTVRRARLDYVSEAAFTVTRPARLRVVLLAKDGWTTTATSRALSLRRRRP